MTQHSSAELDLTQPTASDVPLSERPLVADEQNTVITDGTETGTDTEQETFLSATAQEIRDRLFAPPDAERQPERGLRIGQFEVEERIGSGGMGAVFRAVDTDLSRYVALKVLHPGIAADPSLVARFRNEARACAQLNHDNLARVFFAGEQDGVHYIAYEFADGLTLKELIAQKNRMTSEETINCAIQATLALSHVDAAGIVHRDIKPSNIILTHQGRLKVVDLGLARRDTTDSLGDITVAGTTLGTFDYISPEQARDPRTADIRSDIYSLGCTLYHMLTGQPPYPEGTALQKLLDHQGKSPPDPRNIAPDVSAELADIVREMMNTDPQQRYQDPGQLLADLLSLAAQLGLRSVPAEGIIWRRVAVTRVRELSGALFITGAVVALCVTALVMHFTHSNDSEDSADTQAVFMSLLPPEARPVRSDEFPAATKSGSQNGEPVADGAEPGPGKSAGQQTPSVISPPPMALPTRPFKVIRTNRKEAYFDSLIAAWEAVGSGDVIEFNFEGPLASPTMFLNRPRSGSVQNITLRAAKGLRPLIEFDGNDAQNKPRQLFYLSNDLSLTVIGIDFRVRIPDDATAEWAFFELMGTNQLEVKDCTIDIENVMRKNAAIVRLKDVAGQAPGDVETTISFENVAVRGTCDFVVVQGQTVGSVLVKQCGFALDGSVINNLGVPPQSASASRGSGNLSVRLEHTTSILPQPFVRMQDSDGLNGVDQERELPTVNINAYSNVIASVTPGGTFAHSEGNADLTDMQEVFTWQGNHNFYHQFDVYWNFVSGRVGRVPEAWMLPAWKLHWANSISGYEDAATEFRTAPWVSPSAHQELTREDLGLFRMADLELDKSLFFGSDSGASYRRDRNGSVPGVNTTELPRFPAAVPLPATLEKMPEDVVDDAADQD